MKALLFREFYLGRKYYLLSSLMFLLVMTLSLMMNLSLIYGNLSRLSENSVFQIDENAFTIMKFLPCLVIFISFCTDGGVTFSDYNTNWLKYCSTTPLSYKKIVGVKFISKLITLVIAFVLSLIYTAVLGGITNTPLSFSSFRNLIILFTLAVLFSSIFLTLSIIYKDKNAVAVRMVGIFVVLYIPCVFYMVKLMNNAADNDIFQSTVIPAFENLRKIMLPLSPVIITLSVAVGYIISVRFMKRREN